MLNGIKLFRLRLFEAVHLERKLLVDNSLVRPTSLLRVAIEVRDALQEGSSELAPELTRLLTQANWNH